MYKTTNVITKEFYIGVHSTYNLNDGYLGSGTKLWRKIQKYGRKNFIKEILEYFETNEDKFKRESELVNEEMLQDSLCMNLKEGGSGGFVNEEHRLKFLKNSKEFLRRKWKDETYRKKQIEAIRRGTIKRIQEGKSTPPDWTGKKHSDETKRKIGEKNSKKIGEKNSQYGTCWITNGVESKKIKKEDAEKWIGWKKGRVNVFNNEALEKIKKASVKGKKNSGSGKIWIYKENINKRILPNELNNYLKDNWKKGFKK